MGYVEVAEDLHGAEEVEFVEAKEPVGLGGADGQGCQGPGGVDERCAGCGDCLVALWDLDGAVCVEGWLREVVQSDVFREDCRVG